MAETDLKVVYQENIVSTNESRVALIENVLNFFKESKIQLNIDAYELYLVLDEAITNSMEHGNRWNQEKQVKLRVFNDSSENKVKIRIRDEGIGFNPNILPSVLNANGRLNPRGRGIFILKRFCTVSWNDIGNEISIKIDKK